MKVHVIKNEGTETLEVFIAGTNFGVFGKLDEGVYSYFPKLQDRLTGDHYIAIGKALRKLNQDYTDSEMLDWLESKQAGVSIAVQKTENPWWVCWRDGNDIKETGYCKTPREAIEAAMNGYTDED